MPAIKWLPEALADLNRLHAFLKDKSPAAASRAAAAILQGAENLKQMPKAGRPMQDTSQRREWFVAFGGGSYILRYMLEDENTIVIIRVWHSRENRLPGDAESGTGMM